MTCAAGQACSLLHPGSRMVRWLVFVVWFFPAACKPTAHHPLTAQASTSVRHLLLPCHWSQRNTIVPDLIKCYGAQLESRGGVRRLQMLVFCIQAAIA